MNELYQRLMKVAFATGGVDDCLAVCLDDVTDAVRAMFAEFDKYVIPPKLPENPTNVDLFDFWRKYRLQLREWVARWRLE
jgi:hypothetical protein